MTIAEISAEFLRAVDIQRRIGISPTSWTRWIREGRVGPLAVHIGGGGPPRYRREEIERWIDAGCPNRVTWQEANREARTR